jgi:hypothetical protein
MKVYIDSKCPIAKDSESEIDELTLFPETDIDQHKCRKILDNYETSGCGFSRDGQIYHVSIKLTEKVKSNAG